MEIRSKGFSDCRGRFTNFFRSQEEAYGAAWGGRNIMQINHSQNREIGTIRGIHFQSGRHSEAKIVRCLRGRAWDVAVDLRKDSRSFGKWFGVELSGDRMNAIVIPEGLGHGFQILEQDTELLYIHSGTWARDAEMGIRYDDPTLAIEWPLRPTALSNKDLGLPYFREGWHYTNAGTVDRTSTKKLSIWVISHQVTHI